ncbi:PAC2 family protein [Candidatus Woesearchaeota archaeon]|nr:PAC2 family protein [Candidatus Woesearchaeota archaeon]
MTWKLQKVRDFPKLSRPVLIEGLPGIGNVGKITIDFIVDKLEARKVIDLVSHSFPPSVYINEENLVELPSIEIYHKRIKGRDFLFLAGDVQPVNEESSYEFSETIIDMLKRMGCTEIITMGGIGLPTVPRSPVVFATANSKRILDKYCRSTSLNPKSYGKIGPIVGVTGLLIGLAERQGIDAIALLAETYGHPMYLGIKGAREVMKILNKKLSLGLNLSELNKEIKEIENEMRKIKGLNRIKGMKEGKEMEYIG